MKSKRADFDNKVIFYYSETINQLIKQNITGMIFMRMLHACDIK